MSLIRLGYGRYRDPMTGQPVEVHVDPIPDPIPVIPASGGPSRRSVIPARKLAQQKATDEEILAALAAHDGSYSGAGRALGLSPRTVRKRMLDIRDREALR